MAFNDWNILGELTKADGEVLSASSYNNNTDETSVPLGGMVPWLKTFLSRDSGTTDDVASNKLKDSGQNFVSTVSVGDVVFNTTDDTFAYVSVVDSNIILSIDSDIMANAEAYTIYATPALPGGFVECNGQVLSDADSRYNGATIPDLNDGANKFLRGCISSGSVGGASTVAISEAQMPTHGHVVPRTDDTGAGAGAGSNWTSSNVAQSGNNTTGTKGSGSAHENKPPYYDVVWIIRVK